MGSSIPIQLFKNFDDPMILLGGDSIVFANVKAKERIGGNEAEIIGATIGQYIDFPDKKAWDFIEGRVDDDDEFITGAVLKTSDKQVTIESILLQKFKDGSSNRVLLTFKKGLSEDNSFQTKNHDEFKEFVYIVSHDLKAPLRGILALVDWLKSDYNEEFDQEGKELTDLIYNRTNRLAGMMEGLVQYSRLINNTEAFTSIDMTALCKVVTDQMEIPSNIELELKEMPHVNGQRSRLESLFERLIENSIFFMEKAPGKISIGYDNKLEAYFVNDTGPGVDPGQKDRIFQIFQTLKPKDDVETIGVGLTLAKKIAELHGGNMWLDVDNKIGTRILFTLS